MDSKVNNKILIIYKLVCEELWDLRELQFGTKDNWSRPLNFYLRFVSSDRAGLDGASLVEPGQDLGDAAVRDEELPGDVARPDPHESQLHDTSPNIVRERSTIDEDSPQLVHSCLTLQLEN